jgi:uncharacterized protein with ParB-like and HNH nuclease domain
MANKDSIKPLKIKDLFNSNGEYKIPIYQRNFAWAKEKLSN